VAQGRERQSEGHAQGHAPHATRIAEELLDGEVEALTRKVIDKLRRGTRNGSMAAAHSASGWVEARSKFPRSGKGGAMARLFNISQPTVSRIVAAHRTSAA